MAKSVETIPAPLLGSCRFVLMILGTFAMFLMMFLRFNLSMAIVCMTNSENNNASSYTLTNGTGNIDFPRVGLN